MRRFVNLCTVVLAILLLASCTSQKNLIYFQNDDLKSDNQPDTMLYKYENGYTNSSPEYKLQPHDMIYVQIYSSLDNASSTLFQATGQNQNSSQGSDQSLYLTSYEVDNDGNVDLPTIGKINVLGMSIEEAQNAIKQKAEEFSEGITVTCRMVTFRIKVAGEVNNPGIYTFYQPSVNIFDALLAAGDLTYYGNRQKVRIVRKSETEDAIYTLDIRKASVMKNKNYYLRPGDIVYVEPNKNTKTLQTINTPLTTITSSLSLIASVIAIIVSINNMSK
ncbi:MAG: polysaccharide export protein [Bacteroidales bacterium]|nr:polysaccharide export protein [Bacteroidales bacterium]MBQ6754375.1 polysaccharide export protein [Bacteroidales bacterium]